MVETVIDTCDLGHKFAKLPDHPLRDGRPRCPHCMAKGLDAQPEQQEAQLKTAKRDAILEAVGKYQFTPKASFVYVDGPIIDAIALTDYANTIGKE